MVLFSNVGLKLLKILLDVRNVIRKYFWTYEKISLG